jgi:hypothetical protein
MELNILTDLNNLHNIELSKPIFNETEKTEYNTNTHEIYIEGEKVDSSEIPIQDYEFLESSNGLVLIHDSKVYFQKINTNSFPDQRERHLNPINLICLNKDVKKQLLKASFVPFQGNE